MFKNNQFLQDSGLGSGASEVISSRSVSDYGKTAGVLRGNIPAAAAEESGRSEVRFL
ncbi:hypothetical protein NQZ68_041611 [Dissostichus eleginoides]|nr:hypothetical protein NQZ68_041611 [Dissostichus eleginoides]